MKIHFCLHSYLLVVLLQYTIILQVLLQMHYSNTEDL